MKEITVAFAGNPNVGKSALINAIAGTKLQVGNWPGVTVEKKTATIEYNGLKLNLVDLPGTYSLSPFTQEEVIARNFLIKEKPDLVIDVVDSTNLERNLYLLLQILELGIPVIVALNIFDEAKKKGMEIDIENLEKLLGIKIVPTVAIKGEGVKELLDAVKNFVENKESYLPKSPKFEEPIEDVIRAVVENLKTQYSHLLQVYPARWLAIKLLEEDELILKELGFSSLPEFVEKGRTKIFELYKEDPANVIAEAYYGIAHGIVKESLKVKPRFKPDITERIDKIVLNRFLGFIIFIFIMWLMFKITFDFARPFCDWVDGFIGGFLGKWVKIGFENINAPSWLTSLVVDGIIGGVGAVLVFIPLIGMFMFLVTFLEGSGYLARAAFVMDRIMHTFGLHGKSFIPLIIGFGCNVPSIYATRTLETEKDKKLTATLCPCMSCGARLPVYVLFAGAFFASYGASIIWLLYVIGIFVAVILGIILNKTIYKGEKTPLLMEMPPYRMPTFKYMMIYTWEKLKHFLIKAGTFILATSIVVWILLNIPYGAPKEESLLGRIGKAISPIFSPLGFGNWQASSSLITGIVAKEVIVSTMGEIYGIGGKKEEEGAQPQFWVDLKDQIVRFIGAFKPAIENLFSLKPSVFSVEEEEGGLKAKLKDSFTPLSAFSFLIFVLLYWPCMAFAYTLRAEFGSWKFLGQVVLIYTIVPWIASFIVYQVGRLCGF